MTENKSNGCGCEGTKKTEEARAAKPVEIEFLYLDLDTCDVCRGSESNLDAALAEISTVLAAAGAAVELKKIHVTSYEQALALGFLSSPTIRVDGRDVALAVKENYCAKCSDLSGTETFCRVWDFRGDEYSTVPRPMVVEAVLKAVYGGAESDRQAVPAAQIARSQENLKRFFDGVGARAAQPAAEAKPPAAAVAEAARTGGCGCS